jgi:hypothetical protein
MLSSDKKFGVSDAILEAAKSIIEKKLVGDQKKLDKNHNGHLDKQDFEMLRGKKKMMEAKCPKCGMTSCMCEAVEGSEKDNKEDKKLAKKPLEEMYNQFLAPMTLEQWSHVTNLQQPSMLRSVPSRTVYSTAEFSTDEIARIETIAKGME